MGPTVLKFLRDNQDPPAKTIQECLARCGGDLEVLEHVLIECLAHAVQGQLRFAANDAEGERLIEFFGRVVGKKGNKK